MGLARNWRSEHGDSAFRQLLAGSATVRQVARDDVDVVRAAVTAHEGRDLAAFIREGLGAMDPDDAAELERRVAVWVAEDPMVRHFASDIVWDATAIGVTGTAGGLHELAAWYRDWMGLWETYVYRVVGIREVDGWIITPTDVRARGPGRDRARDARLPAVARARRQGGGHAGLPHRARGAGRSGRRLEPAFLAATASVRQPASSRLPIRRHRVARHAGARRAQAPYQRLRLGRAGAVSPTRC